MKILVIASRGLFVVWVFQLFISCKKFVEIDPPVSDLVRTAVFDDDETAERAVLGLYSQLSNNSSFARGGIEGISFTAGLSGDELLSFYNSSPSLAQWMRDFENNSLLPENSYILTQWSTSYQAIYRANAIIEGLEASSKVSLAQKEKLMGEAKFMRAFCYFYLVNLWGDVPLVLTTDYRTNARILRAPVSQVYDQLITDLLMAQALLPPVSVSNRIRPGKEAAMALLARAYLFSGKFDQAETVASALINSAIVLEPNLNQVFLTSSKEAIWQLETNNTNGQEGRTFIFTTMPVNGALRQGLVNSFEPGDLRRTNWIGNTHVNGTDYFFPWKYKAVTGTPVTEYSIVMRLAEQYLIRAEARAQLNNIAGAQADLNEIRGRANLANTSANDQASLLTAIEQERRVELFTEWGHRWFDLKRTGRVDAMLAPIKPLWSSTSVLYPIPEAQLINNAAMMQNPGY